MHFILLTVLAMCHSFVDCAPGSYGTNETRTYCVLCPRGTYANETGRSTICSECPFGFEQPQYGQTSCSLCALGSHAEQGSLCTTCPIDTYTPRRGGGCASCDDDTGLRCINGLASVDGGWWAYKSRDANTGELRYHTTPCPLNFCPGSQLQIPTVFNSNATIPDPILCVFPRWNSDQNWLCGGCEPGYIVWGTSCNSCDGPNGGLIFGQLVLGFGIVGFLLRSGTGSAGQLDSQ